MLSMPYMPASLFDFSTVISMPLLSPTSGTSISAYVLSSYWTDRVSTNAFVTAFFQFSVREIVTKEPAFFTLNPSRIAPIITIRIATTIRIRFAVSIAVPQFSTPQLLPISQKNPSPAPLGCSKPNHRQLGRESLEERWLQLFRRASFGVSTGIVLFLYFSIWAPTIDVKNLWSLGDTSSIFSALRLTLFTFLSCSENPFWRASFSNS